MIRDLEYRRLDAIARIRNRMHLEGVSYDDAMSHVAQEIELPVSVWKSIEALFIENHETKLEIKQMDLSIAKTNVQLLVITTLAIIGAFVGVM